MLASTDSVAIDTVATLLAGYDQSSVEFLEDARLDGLGTDDPAFIRVVGLDAFMNHRNWLYATYNPLGDDPPGDGQYPFQEGWGWTILMDDYAAPTSVTVGDSVHVSGNTYSFSYTALDSAAGDLGLARIDFLVDGEFVGYSNASLKAVGNLEVDMTDYMTYSHTYRIAVWDNAFNCTLSSEKDFAEDDVVTFADANLEAVIRVAITKPTGDIYASELAGLTELDARDSDIGSLSGIEYCTGLADLDLDSNAIIDVSPLNTLVNLTTLDLYFNQIADIGPLSGLTNLSVLSLSDNAISAISALSGLTDLTELFLSDNEITDISPLVTNEGIDSGDVVVLMGNPLSQEALCSDIPTLEGRGVYVEYDGECSGGEGEGEGEGEG
ncbi:MAG TPA: hypothetical protein HPP77_03625, partial [Candidatus Hydrogenedentes bacterium]|nr:hypothetical protein [Candidatus Hydrogenedentota bacterium]